jgi:hypothetical protein
MSVAANRATGQFDPRDPLVFCSDGGRKIHFQCDAEMQPIIRRR